MMVDFVDGELDVLLCTTIIESGLDIPRANTMFVDRADAFGLAQLYQLRGRIGRSQGARVLLPAGAARGRAHPTRPAAARGAAALHRARRGLPDRVARPRDPRRRRAARRQAVGLDRRGRLRHCTRSMLEEAVAELRGEPIHPRARSRAHDRRARLHPRRLRARHRPAARPLQAAVARRATRTRWASLVTEITDRYGEPPDEVVAARRAHVVKALGAAARRHGARARRRRASRSRSPTTRRSSRSR